VNSHRSSSRAQTGPALRLVSSGGSVDPAGTQAHHSPSLRRYGLASVLFYNGLTLAHYLLGAAVLLTAYRERPFIAWPLALAYVVFALVQFYVLMPLCVCPGCVYRSIPGSRCVAGLNSLSAKLRPSAGVVAEFEERAQGVLCHNTLYVAALVAPLALAIPGLVLAFSWLAVGLAVAVLLLIAVRVEVVFRHLGCPHCLARRWCPNARAMRVV
jgi:hypothetical protein